jgi:hypothetical protein
MQNFNCLAFTQTDLDKYLTIFQVNFRIFLRNLKIFQFLKKVPNKAKFKPSSIFTKNSKLILIFFTPEFALEIPKFQISEYEVHQSSPTDEG